jgi:hypothetical protein
MKAYEITEAGKEALRSGKYKMVSGLLLRQGALAGCSGWGEASHTAYVILQKGC